MRAALVPTLALAALPAAAQEPDSYDGLYRPSPTSDCTVTGADGGALKIEDGLFHGVETDCRMTAPVNVRDMNATLFDMVCEGEGTSFTERAMIMHAADGGIVMVWDGFAFKYDRCPVDPAAGTVTTADDIGIVGQ